MSNPKLNEAVEAEMYRLVTQNEKWFYAVVRKIVRRVVEEEVKQQIAGAAFRERLSQAVDAALRDAPIERMADEMREKALASLTWQVQQDMYNVIRASNEYHDLMRLNAGAGIKRLRQMVVSIDFKG